MLSKVVEVSESRLNEVKSTIEKLARKANKLGIVAPTIEIGKSYNRKVIVTRIHSGFQTDRSIYKTFYPVTITFEPIKVGNYTFVGTIDHANGNIIKSVPGQSIPEKFFNSDCTCDHCNINRYRTETFVFVDSSNEYKRVGRSCLKDYFGIDPSKEIALTESLIEIESDRDINEGGFGTYNMNDSQFDTIETLALGLALTKDFGYVSRKTSEMSDKLSTADNIIAVYFPNNHPDSQEFSEKYYSRIQNSIEAAKEMINWGKEYFQAGNNEYAHNMSIFLNSEVIKVKHFGYLVSLIGAYKLAHTEVKDKVVSEYVGKIGKRQTFEVTCDKMVVTNGYYGDSYLYIMTDKNGNKIVWFSSNNVMNEGDSVTLTASVKDHKEFNGEKQTVITRGKIS